MKCKECKERGRKKKATKRYVLVSESVKKGEKTKWNEERKGRQTEERWIAFVAKNETRESNRKY